MLFSSTVFLFLFLPVAVVFHSILKGAARNFFLFFASLFFYAWGEGFYVGVLLASIVINHGFAQALSGALNSPKAERLIFAGVAFNLALLGFFKYAGFLTDNVNSLLTLLNLSPRVPKPSIHLPIGISFYSFQAIAYLIDVYWEKIPAQRNILRTGLYLSLFPTVLSGPITRFSDVDDDLTERRLSIEKFSSGVKRFIYGLAKKLLLAAPIGAIADQIFILDQNHLTFALAWLGVIAYALQILFDFAGYSDMAVGLGHMLGFRLPENFNHPYIARSMKEFWTRWHISLSSWFRDYLYYPLMMNWRGPVKAHLSVLIVFLLCGLWHGAAWTFVAWGLFHGLFLMFEGMGLQRKISKLWQPLQHAYVLLILSLSWVFFRSLSLADTVPYFQAMAGFGASGSFFSDLRPYSDVHSVLILAAATLCCFPLKSPALLRNKGFELAETGWACGLLLLSLASLAAGTHNPFIYFRF